MEQIKFTKGENKNLRHPLPRESRFSNNKLTPVTLSGVVVPWSKQVSFGTESDYKLVCASGLEYFIVADSEWRNILTWYSWEEVKFIGLLNHANMTLIPQKVFPKGPTGEKEKVIDFKDWKHREIIKKVVKNITDLVGVPAAIWAVAAM